MTTITRRGSGTPATTSSSGTWATVTNAVDGTPPANPATYAVWTSTGSSASGSITPAGYDFSSIPAGATINSVTVTLRHFENNITRIPTVRVTPQSGLGGYNLQTLFTCTVATAARDDTQVYTTGLIMDLAELQGGCKFNAAATRAAVTQSATFNVDHIDVTVDYTVAGADVTGTAEGSITVTGAGAGGPTPPVTGTAVGSLAVVGTSSGIRDMSGTAVGALAVVGVAVGAPATPTSPMPVVAVTAPRVPA